MRKKTLKIFKKYNNKYKIIIVVHGSTITIDGRGSSMSLVALEKELLNKAEFVIKKLILKNFLEVELQDIPNSLVCKDVGNVKIKNFKINISNVEKQVTIFDNYDYIRVFRYLINQYMAIFNIIHYLNLGEKISSVTKIYMIRMLFSKLIKLI